MANFLQAAAGFVSCLLVLRVLLSPDRWKRLWCSSTLSLDPQGKRVDPGLDNQALELEHGVNGMKTWLLWVLNVWVGDLARAALDLRGL
jgi:hypothetical protein